MHMKSVFRHITSKICTSFELCIIHELITNIILYLDRRLIIAYDGIQL